MRTIRQALEPYGPAICPRCGEPAVAFFGRYNMICGECWDECGRGAAKEDTRPLPDRKAS